jgi:hypothetical protein
MAMDQRNWVIKASAFLGALFLVLSTNRTHAQIVYALQRIPAGTIVVDAEADRWNELILLARPSLTSGDLDRLPLGLQQAVTRFSYTVLATVSTAPPEPDPAVRGLSPAESPETAIPPARRYWLAEVGVGYSAPLDGVQKIVSASPAAEADALGIIERQVVAQNERDLDKARVVVRSSTLIMFDLDVILAGENGHRVELSRSLVWIDPLTGKSAIAMWLLGQRKAGPEAPESLHAREDAIQVHPGGTRASNRLHVDASTFVLGIPTATSFGLERLLPGRQVPWTDSLSNLAGKSSYEPETLAEFTVAFDQAIRAAAKGPAAAP